MIPRAFYGTKENIEYTVYASVNHEPIVQEWWAWSMTGLWMCIWKMIQYSLYIQWDFQGPPRTWDLVEAPYYSLIPLPVQNP